MNDIVESWRRKRAALEAEAAVLKNSQMVSFGLLEEYDKLSPLEKEEIRTLLREWLFSDDASERYDACFLISQKRISEMVTDVSDVVREIETRSDPTSVYEAKKLKRIIGELS